MWRAASRWQEEPFGNKFKDFAYNAMILMGGAPEFVRVAVRRTARFVRPRTAFVLRPSQMSRLPSLDIDPRSPCDVTNKTKKRDAQ